MDSTILVMKENTAVIQSYFAKLGIHPEVIAIYLALFTQGKQSISELARSSGIERTRIYRLHDELLASGLVEVEMQYKRSIYSAAPIENIQSLIAKKEQEVRDLQSDFKEIQHLFSAENQKNGTRVQFYKGAEGLKQMFWNQSKAQSEVLVILSENMQTKTNSSFFERWVRRCNERGIKSRGIVGDAFIESQAEWYARRDNERLEQWEAVYLPSSTFTINHSTALYDNVVTYQNWKDGDIFGFEIYNPDIVVSQRQYFELLWKLGQPLEEHMATLANRSSE